MAAFVPGQTIASAKPAVQVDATLPPGIYRFQLVVVDDGNVVSEPAHLLVRIAKRDASDT